MEPTRLDKLMVERGLARSRAEAHSLIAQGQVIVAGRAAAKPSLLVNEADTVTVVGERLPYVSRGGLKLAAALDSFGIAVAGQVALDVGASTGGFTDCLLQRGAARVVAIDSGHGQMASLLREDPRVELRERVNVRDVTPADFPAPFALIVVDISFISLTLALPPLAPILRVGGDLICLVKPQFEAGQQELDNRGVVRSPQARLGAVQRVVEAAARLGLQEQRRMDSPITGTAGNQETLLWLRAEAGNGSESGE